MQANSVEQPDQALSRQQAIAHIQRRLGIVQWAAWIDLILLIALLTASFSKQRDFVHVLGPLHGINFLLLVVIAGTAALDGVWSWWFPIAIFFTGGAPGALIGEWMIKRRIQSRPVDVYEEATPRPKMPADESAPASLQSERDASNTAEKRPEERKEQV